MVLKTTDYIGLHWILLHFFQKYEIEKFFEGRGAVGRHFLESFAQKMSFFGARSPLIISIYWRQKGFSKQFKGVSLGSEGDRILKESKHPTQAPPHPHSHPKSASDKIKVKSIPYKNTCSHHIFFKN